MLSEPFVDFDEAGGPALALKSFVHAENRREDVAGEQSAACARERDPYGRDSRILQNGDGLALCPRTFSS
jgi:hypothetical protein